VLAAGLAVVMATGGAAVARADDPPAFSVTFPAGLACPFELQVDGYGAGSQVVKTFTDRHGNVKTLTAGTGNALVFTNTDNDATYSTRANGSVTQIVSRPDGSSTIALAGHNVLFLFPTDVPAGPSTTLYVGWVVVDVDAAGVYTVRSASGSAFDICAAVAR